MAIGTKMMAARFNRDDFSPMGHFVYAVAGDGDLMEGVSAEASSLAGHLKLNNLIVIYDDNKITIDGSTDLSFSEDVAKRFEAYGWFTQRIDGHNHAEIASALERSRAQKDRPSMILARTHIGFGSPHKADTSKAHGSLWEKRRLRRQKKLSAGRFHPRFLFPKKSDNFLYKERPNRKRKKEMGRKPGTMERKTSRSFKSMGCALEKKKFRKSLRGINYKPSRDARRNTLHIQQNRTDRGQTRPFPRRGSADLGESTKTEIHGSTLITGESFEGRNIAFGIREHAMGAIMNGLSLYGSFIPLGSTFLIFSDYMRPRFAWLHFHTTNDLRFHARQRFSGEDGPTHQAGRATRVAATDSKYGCCASRRFVGMCGRLQIALSRKKGPTAIALTRQKLPEIKRDADFKSEETLKAHTRRGEDLMTRPTRCHRDRFGIRASYGSGAKLSRKEKDSSGLDAVRGSFEAQSEEYQNQILPPNVPTAAIEAGRSMYWKSLSAEKGS